MASAMLNIRLFGPLDLRLGEVALPPLESARAESLLAALLLERDAPRSRQALAFQLWPDSSESQARTNLRHLLHTLRRALPDIERYLEITPRTIQWRAVAPYRLDVEAFEAALARAEREPDGGPAALREAVDLYGGDLLEGCYDEWLLARRDAYQQRFLGALERLALLHESRGEHAQATTLAERLLRHDPLQEQTWRLLMRLHDARGDRARALRTYHACATTLERELGIEPSRLTREAYEALLALDEPAPPDALPGRAGELALVGRSAEWTRLVALWRAAEGGQARFALLSGEPGSGKTRLAEELRSWVVHRGAMAAEGRSYAAEGELAWGPVVAWLRSDALRPQVGRLPAEQRTELARLLPELLASPGVSAPEPLPESDRRRRLFDALARALLSSGGPLLLVVDDLHWSDRETLGLLHFLLRAHPEAPLLVVATVRREELDGGHPLHELLAGLRALDRLEEIPLGPLSRDETSALAEHLAGRPLPAAEAERLFTETEGNPLIVIEALRAGWPQRDGSGPLSPRIQEVIQSRLSQLSEVSRDLAGTAATIGRAFSTGVLGAAAGSDDDALVRGLDELWRRGMIREQGLDAYDFSHDQIRRVAYQALGPAERRRRHRRVALALERLNGTDPGSVSGQIAAHFEQAGDFDQAVTWYERAAEAAQRVYAHDEAARLLDRGLDLLRANPSLPERESRELALLTALPGPLVATEGYLSERLSLAQQRALDLAAALGRDLEPPLLRSLALARLSQGDFEAARDFGERLYARGERDADDVLLVEAGYVQGIAAHWSGELEAAQQTFEGVLRRYRPERRPEHLQRYGQDPIVLCGMRLAHTLALRGLLDSAARLRDETLARAGETGHRYSLTAAHVFALLVSVELRDFERVRGLVSAMLDRRQGTDPHHIQVVDETFTGLVDALDGRGRAGVERIQRVLELANGANQAPGQRAFLIRILLEACRVAGSPEAGLAAVAAMLDGCWERLWDSEAHRLRAEFNALLGAPPERIEPDLLLALDVATRQHAPLPRLRAAAALLRHRRQHAGPAALDEARALLAGIVAALPEGHATPEVIEAAALLA